MPFNDFDKSLEEIKELLKKRVGQNPEALNSKTWRRAFKERLSACGFEENPAGYLKFLKQNEDEFQKFLEHILVTETWFFRDDSSLELISELVLARIRKGVKALTPLRFLIAPCATGEEAYSLAIYLKEKGISLKNIEIDAVDVSQEALVVARSGLFGKNSFRGGRFKNLESYFKKTEDGRYQLDDSILQVVHFQHVNLVDPSFYMHKRPYFAIFCRNLLIYLTPDVQKKLVCNLKKLLEKKGVLFVAPSEGELVKKEGFTSFGKVKYMAFQEVEKNKKDSLKLVKLKENPFGTELLGLKLSSLGAPPLLLKEAGDLANEGFFESALEKCRKYMNAHPLDPEAPFLLGVIFHALGNMDESEKAFQKAIYLKPSHYGSLIYLSLIAEKKGLSEKAALFKRRAEKEQLSITNRP